MDGLSFTTFLKLTLMPTTQGKLGVLHRMHNSSDGYDFYKRLKLGNYILDKAAHSRPTRANGERDENLFDRDRKRDRAANLYG